MFRSHILARDHTSCGELSGSGYTNLTLLNYAHNQSEVLFKNLSYKLAVRDGQGGNSVLFYY